MGFSKEWDDTYKRGLQNSIWPWSDVVTLFYHYFKGDKEKIRVLELGCGAGANIPFFASLGVMYYGIEGSETKVKQLRDKYPQENILVVQGDFTKGIPFDRKFDLVLDRSSVTHNKTEDIQNVLKLVYEKIDMGGYYFGLDWFSSRQGSYSIEDEQYDVVDGHTRVFSSGYFAGLGNVHFSDGEHIKSLMEEVGMELVELYEKVEYHHVPQGRTFARWNYVAQRKQ